MPIENDTLVRILLRDREKLFAYCWAILRDHDLAEEVFQEISVLALQKRESIKDVQHFAGWLREAARRKSLEAVRARRAKPALMDNALLDLLEPEWRRWDDTPSNVLLEALRKCMGRLGQSAKELVELRYGQGLKSAQIANKLQRKVETVYVSLSRIHSRLADCVRHRLSATNID